MRNIRDIYSEIKTWFQPSYGYVIVDDFPETFNDKKIYIVGGQYQAWLIAFICPCGCHSIIQLNLLKTARPRWSYTIQKGKLSISPSVWRKVGCKSHFFVKKNKILWAGDY